MGEHKHTPGPWEAYDPCYGTCGMPCTPDGCHESHPVGDRRVSGPEGVDGDIELNTEADARLIAAAPDLLEAICVAINTVECDSLGRDGNELPWYRMARAAIAKATASPSEAHP